MRWATLAALAVFLVVVSVGSAQGSEPFQWFYGNSHFQANVETQPGVVNDTGCSWDPDDQIEIYTGGYLDPGESASVSICNIADWDGGPVIGVYGTARSDDLALELNYEPPGQTFALRPPSGKPVSNYKGCLVGPIYEPDFSGYQQIPNSNGGIGVPTTVTLTITNEGARRVRDIQLHLKLDIAYAPVEELLCFLPFDHEGVFDPGPRWQVGL